MKKSRISLKGEYNFGKEIYSPSIRNFQELIDSRNRQMTVVAEQMNGEGHKMEFVKDIRGVDFINDSASSNLNGFYMALANVDKPVTWITSFREWEKLYSDLIAMITDKVRYVVVLGDVAQKTKLFLEALDISFEESSDIETAVRKAFYATESNNAVLFSPGVGTEGEFENYSERGNQFKMAVAQL